MFAQPLSECFLKGWTKPSGGASRKAKEEWLKSKYLWKGFLEYQADDGHDQADRETSTPNCTRLHVVEICWRYRRH
jgi:hypothetical protein